MANEYLENIFKNLIIHERYKDILEKEGFYKECYFNNTHCLLLRGRMGTWCGYVALSKNHKDYNSTYEDVENLYTVHGGITFYGSLNEIDNSNLHGYKWVGFDCGHYNDISPINTFEYDSNYAEYRDLEYVESELKKLSYQVYNRSLSKKIKDVFKKL